ncbi:MAG TPA: hypothetical protein VMF61_16365, partial [Candidatus Acidoferrales bacterium]|nr:hypothetical protein [Candidatus Acidoferrales bacterium]
LTKGFSSKNAPLGMNFDPRGRLWFAAAGRTLSTNGIFYMNSTTWMPEKVNAKNLSETSAITFTPNGDAFVANGYPEFEYTAYHAGSLTPYKVYGLDGLPGGAGYDPRGTLWLTNIPSPSNGEKCWCAGQLDLQADRIVGYARKDLTGPSFAVVGPIFRSP